MSTTEQPKMSEVEREGMRLARRQFERDAQVRADALTMPRDQWGPREWAALDRFMGECWDGRMGQRVD